MQKIKKLTPKVLDSMESMRPFMFKAGVIALEKWCAKKGKSVVMHRKSDGYALCYIRSTGQIC